MYKVLIQCCISYDALFYFMDRTKLYEEYMEKRSGKHLRNPGNADPGNIEPEYYKDILPQDKE